MIWKERAWTKALLRELYPLGSKGEILEKLKGRSWLAIMCKAGSLKVRRLKNGAECT